MQTRTIRKISATSKFIRSLKKLPEPIQGKLDEREKIFRNNAFDPRLGTHKLKGHLKEFWSYSIDYQYRVVFEFDNRDEVVHHDVGDHSIYR